MAARSKNIKKESAHCACFFLKKKCAGTLTVGCNESLVDKAVNGSVTSFFGLFFDLAELGSVVIGLP